MVVERFREAGFEYRSRLRLGGVPVVHVVRGVDPATGRRPPAIGILAIGQVAVGLVAIGQLSVGVVAIGQLAIGALAGLGQVAFALLAIGQIAGGALASIGQAALGPRSIGIVRSEEAGWPLLWVAATAICYVVLAYRDRGLAPLLEITRQPPTVLGRIDDGVHWIRARIASEDDLRAPISNAPCAHWEALRAGAGMRTREHGGERLVVADDTGTAEVALENATFLIRNGSYSDLPAPDWTVQMESFLTKGEEIHVVGPAALAPNQTAAGLYRGRGLTPVFEARPDAPLLVSTESPATLQSGRRFVLLVGGILLAASLAAALHALALG
jgi:hypothetical protein